MKVAIITSGYLPVPAVKGGAVETLVDELIEENEESDKIKFEVFSMYDKAALEASEKYRNTKINFIKINKFIEICDKFIYWFVKNIIKKQKDISYRYIIQRISFINKVSKSLRKNNYDKVIIQNHPTLFLTLKLRKNYIKYNDKYYYHIHNDLNKTYGCNDIIKKSKKILCVSNYIKDQVEKRLGLQDKTKCVVLKNSISIERFEKKYNEYEIMQLKEKYGIEKNDKVLIFVGRLTKEKGIKELLLALKKVKYEEYKLLVVGSYFFATNVTSDFKLELDKLKEELRDKIIFTGYIDYKEIQKIYAISDIAVLPSMWNEPAGLTVLEAMASGLPVITTNSGGIPEYAKNGCAKIIERDEKLIDNLAKEIENLLNNYEERIRMSAISRFESDKYNSKILYEKFYHEIM